MANKKLDVRLIEEVTEPIEASSTLLKSLRESRAINVNPVRPSEADLKNLDSSVKRNTALIKKLKASLTEEGAKSLIDDILKTNQSKYVSEAVTAISEAPLNIKDLPIAVNVCGLLHRRYPEFCTQIGPALAKVFSAKPSSGEDERSILKRRRSSLRLLHDLFASGILKQPGMQPLVGIVQELSAATGSIKKDREGATNALALLSQFAKVAREALLGLPPLLPQASLIPDEVLKGDEASLSSLPEDARTSVVKLKAANAALKEELSLRFVAADEERSALGKALGRSYQSSCAALVEEHAALGEQEKENTRIINTRGDLPPDMAAEYEKKRKAYELLHRATAALAECLDKPMPELVEDAFTRLSNAPAPAPVASTGEDASLQVFEDVESRMFYESLPDIRSMVPAVLLGLPSNAAKGEAEEAESAEEGPSEPLSTPSEDEAAAEEAVSKEEGGEEPGQEQDVVSDPVKEGEGEASAEPASATEGKEGGRSQLDHVLSKLPYCVSRDTCDEISVNFCFSNSKSARKRLVRALCDVPKACLQLVPYFARIVATLAQVFPDIPQGVIHHLEVEFHHLQAKKDATAVTLEPRVRNARYLAELAKFKCYPHGSFFVALKSLLDDFTHHNIDAACAMVETAGRALIRTPESKVRMENMLEVMMKLKNVKNMDSRRSAQIDWAYTEVKQPGRANQQRKKRPPMQEYIRHLIFTRLSKATAPDVAKKLLRVPWAESERYVLKCLLKVVRMRFTNIPLISSLVGGLAQAHDSLGVAFVDQVLEDIRWGMENPGLGTYQKRLADVKLLGELYNYQLFNNTPIFETLYLIITFGHETPELMSKLDAPDDYFRIRMVCSLLDTCGSYIGSGRSAWKLNRFISFFQAYLLSKQQPIPLDVEFDVGDILNRLRPRLVRLTSYEEALQVVMDIISREAANELKGRDGLGAINEEMEEEDGGRSPANESNEADEGEDDEDDDEDDDEEEEEEESNQVREEDADFERDYMLLLGVDQPKVTLSRNIPHLAAPPVEDDEDDEDEDDEGGGGVRNKLAFKMLMKKGGKDDKSREIYVPSSTPMAVSLRLRAEAEAKEREEVKRLTSTLYQQQESEQAASARAQLRGWAGGLPGGQQGPPHGQPSYGGAQDEMSDPRRQHYMASSHHPAGNVDALGLHADSVPRGPRQQPQRKRY